MRFERWAWGGSHSLVYIGIYYNTDYWTPLSNFVDVKQGSKICILTMFQVMFEPKVQLLTDFWVAFMRVFICSGSGHSSSWESRQFWSLFAGIFTLSLVIKSTLTKSFTVFIPFCCRKVELYVYHYKSLIDKTEYQKIARHEKMLYIHCTVSGCWVWSTYPWYCYKERGVGGNFVLLPLDLLSKAGSRSQS